MSLGIYAVIILLLVAVALLALEIIAGRRAEALLQRELLYWYEEAWKQRRMREHAELGYTPEPPAFLFPDAATRAAIQRRIYAAPQS